MPLKGSTHLTRRARDGKGEGGGGEVCIIGSYDIMHRMIRRHVDLQFQSSLVRGIADSHPVQPGCHRAALVGCMHEQQCDDASSGLNNPG